MTDIKVKVELTAEECAHLLNMLDYLKAVIPNIGNDMGMAFSIIVATAQVIRDKVYQSMIDSKEISLYCAKKDKAEQELLDYAKSLINGDLR